MSYIYELVDDEQYGSQRTRITPAAAVEWIRNEIKYSLHALLQTPIYPPEQLYALEQHAKHGNDSTFEGQYRTLVVSLSPSPERKPR